MRVKIWFVVSTLLLPIWSTIRVGAQASIKTNTGAITITHSEPGILSVERLYASADKVVIVETTSGDNENYDQPLYKAKVLKSFKGSASGETIFFGPYVGTKVGWSYLLFLRTVKNPISPKTKATAYGTVSYSNVFNEGYSSMEISRL